MSVCYGKSIDDPSKMLFGDKTGILGKWEMSYQGYQI